MPILDDQGAEALLAVGFTGVLASWSRRGSPTWWPREPGRPDRPAPGAPNSGESSRLRRPITATRQLPMDRARGAPSHGAPGPDALAARPQFTRLIAVTSMRRPEQRRGRRRSDGQLAKDARAQRVVVSSTALEPRRTPLVSEAESKEKSSYCYLANGLPVSRGGRMPILDDQGAEALLAVGFTGVLASRSTRGSPTEWPREPRRPDGPDPGAPDVRVIAALAMTRAATSRLSMDRARGAPSHGALGPDALAARPQNTRLTAVTPMRHPEQRRARRRSNGREQHVERRRARRHEQHRARAVRNAARVRDGI
jgi:hypothetical protein